MKLKTRRTGMILAAALALTGCGDDDAGGDGDGSTGGSSSSGVTTDDSTTSTTATPSSSSTSSADGSSSGDETTGGSSSGSDSSSGGESSSSGGSTSTGMVETVSISGVVTDFGSTDVLPDIEVCVYEQESIPCATTDAEGAYTLMGVPVAEGAIEFTGTGRFPSLFWGEGPMEDDVLNYNLLSNVAAAVLAAQLGEEIDDADGHLALAVSDGAGSLLSGVTFTMTPTSGALGYLTPQGIDTKLTATTEVGFAGWLNVDVGEVEITASHPTLDCVPGPGALVGSRPNALRIEIVAGYLGSTFPFVCS